MSKSFMSFVNQNQIEGLWTRWILGLGSRASNHHAALEGQGGGRERERDGHGGVETRERIGSQEMTAARRVWESLMQEKECKEGREDGWNI